MNWALGSLGSLGSLRFQESTGPSGAFATSAWSASAWSEGLASPTKINGNTMEGIPGIHGIHDNDSGEI